MDDIRGKVSDARGALEKLIEHLMLRWALRPTTLDHVVAQLPVRAPSVYIYVALGDAEMTGNGGLSKVSGLNRFLNLILMIPIGSPCVCRMTGPFPDRLIPKSLALPANCPGKV